MINTDGVTKTIDAAGGNATGTITANASYTGATKGVGLKWAIVNGDNNNWVTVSPSSGTGNGSVTFSAEANVTGALRSQILKFRCAAYQGYNTNGYAEKTITINQDAQSAVSTTYTLFDGVSNAIMYIDGTAVTGGTYTVNAGDSITGYFLAINNQRFDDNTDIVASGVTFTKSSDVRMDFSIPSVNSDITFTGGPSITAQNEYVIHVYYDGAEIDPASGSI